MEPKVIVNGKEYTLLLEDQLTLGEAAELERIAGIRHGPTRGAWPVGAGVPVDSS